MTLNKHQVLHIANISNLQLTDDDIDKYAPQLSKIVEYVNLLNEVDTDNVNPTYQVVGLENVFHKDEIEPLNVLNNDKVFLNTNSSHNGLFKVDAILKERTSK